MNKSEFETLIAEMTAKLQGRSLDSELQDWLNAEHGPGTDWYERAASACQQAVADGWMCDREHGGIRFGRVIKPTDVTHGFSVDVVEMDNIVGPHHGHPNGEIDLVMPLTDGAKFDGQGAGWKVYGPGSAHKPTVTDGRAYVLYLLPEGAIDFKAAG